MTGIVDSIAAECRRYKALGERAMEQLEDDELVEPGPLGGLSVAMLARHISGNLSSRFTDFLTTDGEKPWRARDEEFVARSIARREVIEAWEHGWRVLLTSLSTLTEQDLRATVMIRGEAFRVHEALHRALGHLAYHVGQIVYLAKARRGSAWRSLSIPLGGSEVYNRDPASDRPEGHVRRLGEPANASDGS